MPSSTKGLTPRQERFVAEYALDANATQAAIRAGYSKRSAHVEGSRLLRNAVVAAAIAAARQARLEELGVRADRVLEEIRRVALADIREIVQWGATGLTVTPSDQLSPEQAAAVLSIKRTSGQFSTTYEVKLHDKLRALEQLGKHLGLFSEKHEHVGKGGGPVEHVVRVVRE